MLCAATAAPSHTLQADILVSELLGSFGDNELSPECLDGAQRLLKADGISIPCSYTSFLAPVTTSKLYDAVKGYKDLEHYETPYVVKFHRWVNRQAGAGVFRQLPVAVHAGYSVFKVRIEEQVCTLTQSSFIGFVSVPSNVCSVM